MNIFKRFGSFAVNSWKDFSDYYDAEHRMERAKSTDALRAITDSPRPQEISVGVSNKAFEEEDFVRRPKPLPGPLAILRKRNKKKLVPVDDPRSPTQDFARTPIQTINDCPTPDLLSPFDVKDMLKKVDSAVCLTPIKKSPENTVDEETSQLLENLTLESLSEVKSEEMKEKPVAKEEEVEEEKDLLKVDDICNWKQYEFREKPITDSMIVEVSSVCNVDPSTANEDTVIGESEETNCKVVGYSVKPVVVQSVESEEMFSTSTPKKSSTILTPVVSKIRTPLKSISNSPLASKGGSLKKKENNKPLMMLKKKKLATGCARQLPKAPSTPMTPLFKPNTCVIDFDKENY